MPTPTDTFRNISRLNLLFFASALLLTLGVIALILADYQRDWRLYQRQATAWEAALTRDAARLADSGQVRAEEARLSQRIEMIDARLRAEGVADEIARLRAEQDQHDQAQKKISLRLATIKGEITPLEQQIERARLSEDAEAAAGAEAKLREVRRQFGRLNEEMAGHKLRLTQIADTIRARQELLNELDKERQALVRARDAARKRVEELQPSSMARRLREVSRNAPLLDWMNPSEAIQQDVVPDIRTDLNFLTVETTDRCRTCHVNIAKPQFERGNLLAFVERQVATAQGQDVAALARPVVLVEFWEEALALQGGRGREQLAQARARTTQAVNRLRAEAGMEPLAGPEALAEELERIRLAVTGEDRPRWYQPLEDHLEAVRGRLREALGEEEFARLLEVYRVTLVERFNQQRRAAGLDELAANAVLLGHPEVDLFVYPDSPHPLKTMGCTSCHEGSGQETHFLHAAHTPREIWVDAQSGVPVPDALVVRVDSPLNIERLIQRGPRADQPVAQRPAAPAAPTAAAWIQRGSASAEQPPLLTGTDSGAAAPADPAVAVPADAPASTGMPAADHAEDAADHAHRYYHHDLNLADPRNPAPFAPEYEPAGMAAAYRRPLDEPGTLHRAVRQAEYWQEQYGWHPVDFMHWEKPMHRLDYVQSSCAKCHSEIYDLEAAAPRLFEGRRLFAQLGCVNCHAVTDMQDDLDLRQVGPSLVHVKHKLTPAMAANWIWAPKAFRPFARMPHYFMQENNSAPVDLQRTRVEVAAITQYLMTAQPDAEFYEKVGQPVYQPEPPPAEAGDPAKGRALFNHLGCLACHTNMEEVGEPLIVNDLMAREGLELDSAKQVYADMAYNQRHQYALAHLEDRIVQVGPELSGFGSKMLLGREGDPEVEAQARAWTYDWIRNPRHYADHTIMPSLRLSEEEANHIAAFLLSLRRPMGTEPGGYQPADFFAFDPTDQAMLHRLVVHLKAGQITESMAENEVRGMTEEEKLLFLGQKMVGHYGCNGCHQINGFEEAASACTVLDDWGVKDPHKLDFGYFDAPFDEQRQKPMAIWKTPHSGLTADAPQVGTGEGPQARQVAVQWEHVEHTRRPWLYHKLHNTRVYDRGRTALEGSLGERPEDLNIGRPYDKLKMPVFYLRDDQVRALVTFVTSIRQPLVSDNLRQATYSDARRRMVLGRQVAAKFNCYGCHNIEGNEVHIQQFFHVYDENGRYDQNAMNYAPPRLVGQGARTQPNWLYNFLQDVRPIRPWLQIRMPSFHFQQSDRQGRPLHNDARYLVDYFAGHAQVFGAELASLLDPIDTYLLDLDRQIQDLEKNDLARIRAEHQQRLTALADQGVTGEEAAKDRLARQLAGQIAALEAKKERLAERREHWYAAEHEGTAAAIRKLRELAQRHDLVAAEGADPRGLDPDFVDDRESLKRNWDQVLRRVRALALAAQTTYPYVEQPRPAESPERLLRGEKLFAQLGCMAGQCHRFGDEEILAQSGLLFSAPPIFGAAEADQADGEDGFGASDDFFGSDDSGFDDPFGVAAEAGPQGLPLLNLTPALPAAGAPNLMMVHDRLQPHWVDVWVRHATTIQPGTRMQEFWKDGQSFFTPYPEDMRRQHEAIVGYTAQAQRELLMDFLYAAGTKRVTYNAEGARLAGGPAAEVQLTALEPAPQAPAPAGEAESEPAAEAPAPTAELPADSEPFPAPAAARPAASTINLEDLSAGGRVVGVVQWEGPIPRRRPVRMGDPLCMKQHDAPPLDEVMVVNDDNTMQHVFIYVVEGLPAGQSFPPREKPVLDQVGCMYTPHVLGVMAGQPFTVHTSDAILHNVNAQPTRNRGFNTSMPVKGMSFEAVFEQPELGIPVKCDVHPWMAARIHVVDNPFFAVSDVQGRFEIAGLPAGTYTLRAVPEHPRLKPVDFQVEVRADGSARTDVTLAQP